MKCHSKKRRRRVGTPLLCAVFVLVTTELSGAQTRSTEPVSTAEDPSLAGARRLYIEGLSLAKQDRFEEAIDAFRRSEELKPHPITSYNLAYCERSLGRQASAWRHFSAALSASGTAPGTSLPAAYEAKARQWLAEAEQNVSRVAIRMNSPLVLRIDGQPIHRFVDSRGLPIYLVDDREVATESAIPQAIELWLDAGEHTLVASLASGALLTRRIVAPTGVSSSVDLETPAPLSQPRVVPEHLSPARSAIVHREPNRVPAYVAFGVGGAALIAGSVFMGLTLHEKSILDPQCPAHHCPAELQDERDRMMQHANYATVSLGVAVVGLSVGTVLWFTSKPSSIEVAPSRTTRLEPFVGLKQVGIRGTL